MRKHGGNGLMEKGVIYGFDLCEKHDHALTMAGEKEVGISIFTLYCHSTSRRK